MPGYTYLYETKSLSEKSYTRYTVFFDIDDNDKKPKAWIFIKKFKEVNDDNQLKVIDETFTKMTEDEIAKTKGLRIKVIRFRNGMSYNELLTTVHW